jgi:hypothetical protein
MKNFKFNALSFMAIILMLAPIPFALAWGYMATPIAIVCLAAACLIIRKLIKSI